MFKFLKDDAWNTFNNSDLDFLKIYNNDSEYILKFIEINRFKIKQKLVVIFNQDTDLYIKRLIYFLYYIWNSSNDFRFINKFISKNEKYFILKAVKNF